ncbi:MAG: cofactor-independent phosphoglycerate mutase [Deltaproteobacteria bacterium]|nr:cofactor-independent phosphoglycerate mutase [Deltaproteobacteria bacterium]
MKYIVLLGDGMADWPHEHFGGRTVLDASETPNMDAMCRHGELGLVNTITPGFPPGSDTTNMSIMGYSPAEYYTGRAPLEAASVGVELGPEDVAIRCNLVSLRDSDEGPVMHDYSAGHITTEDATPLIEALDAGLRDLGARLYLGTSYRHLLVVQGVDPGLKTTPPHDITNKVVTPYLPTGEGQDKLRAIIEKSREILADLPANQLLKTPVTQVWLWGQGKAPVMPPFIEKFGLKAAMVSAVDLLKGIGKYVGMKVVIVPGATGYLDTNYSGKVAAAMDFLADGGDFVYLHVEAPDECGHNGIPEDKQKAIEDFDALVVGPIFEQLKTLGEDYRVLLMPDHPTPLELRTHASEPVPFMIYDSTDATEKRTEGYCEKNAKATGLTIESGMALFGRFTQRDA